MKMLLANMKMNLSLEQINDYIERTRDFKDDIIVIPSSIYIPYFIKNNYRVGIQNISRFDNGAYTGDISASQVKSMGVDYTLIGHSERRNIFNESLDDVRNKVIKALENNLKVILCIGESLEQKNNNLTEKVLNEQITSALDGIDISNIIIAYEPIYSIGTGIIPTNEEIENVTSYIKKVVKELHNKDIDVLYGGSVNDKNIQSLKTIDNVSGFLIGGASLDPNKLLTMLNEVRQ